MSHRLLASLVIAALSLPVTLLPALDFLGIGNGEMQNPEPPMAAVAVWGLAPKWAGQRWARNEVLQAQLIHCTSGANIVYPGERPTYTVQFANLTDRPVHAKGRVRIIQYELFTPGEYTFNVGMRRVADHGTTPIEVQVDAKGWVDVPITPDLPQANGGYALIIEFDGQDALFGAATVRTFKPSPRERQFYRLTMDLDEPEVLSRLGVTANRIEIGYKPTTDADFEQWYARATAPLVRLRAAKLPVCIEFGGGAFVSPQAPLGRDRPWLDEQGVMLDTKSDVAWLPSSDADFKQFIKRFARDWGWPKGPVNAMKLWNEPWNGISISHWGADDVRYREIFTKLCEGVEESRAEAGVQILLGGCDSTSNTHDKLFADGRDDFLHRLDFVSIHYQGNDPQSTTKLWRDRKGPDGKPAPVRIWDTESWVANSDDRVAGVLAAMFSFGQDRVVGMMARHMISAQQDCETSTTSGRERRRISQVWSPAAAVGAFQHFVGERPFNGLLFRPGLPFVMEFVGETDAQGKRDDEDATLVVLGDMGSIFGQDGVALRTCRSLAEIRAKEELRVALRALPADSPERASIEARLIKPMPYQGCTLTIPADASYSLFDFYGNAVAAVDGRIVVPLDARGFYLRGNGRSGSHARLVAAVKAGRIDGLSPVAISARDMTAPVSAKPVLGIELLNVLNRPVTATLRATLADLPLAVPESVTLQPGERKTVELTVTGGQARPDNRYPLRLIADFGADGRVVHDEDMRVNWVAKRTVEVDGRLDEWQDAIPQSVVFTGQQTMTLTEKAWLPFMPADESVKQGFAIGYLAYDADHVYFAAKINDTTPHPGAPRFADRSHEDGFFYPEVSYRKTRDERTGVETTQEHRWPPGVRRYSYRANPVLPCGNAPNLDNIQIAFNVLADEAKPLYPFPPGTFKGYIMYPTTDYEYALNTVAARFGGGTEVWRLARPGMPHKHFYPRQPASPEDGPAQGAKLVTVHEGGTRITECAIPWSEIPAVKAAVDAGRPVHFSFRVNDDAGVGCLELARGRSASNRGHAFRADWVEHWTNEIVFGFEK